MARRCLRAAKLAGRSAGEKAPLPAHGLDYAVVINGMSKVWTLDALDRRRGDAVFALDLSFPDATRSSSANGGGIPPSAGRPGHADTLARPA